MFFTAVTKNRQTTPTTRPSTSAPIGPAKPEAGVTATRPATQPDAMPSIEGLPLKIHSANIQDSAAAAVATNELIIAIGAPPTASRLEPALKPNQPTHSSEAPIMVMTSESVRGGVDGVRTGPVPDHVRDREVDQRHPQRDENRHRRELHAFGEGADDEGRRDCGEGHLEADVDVFADRHPDREGRRLRVGRDTLQEQLVEA